MNGKSKEGPQKYFIPQKIKSKDSTDAQRVLKVLNVKVENLENILKDKENALVVSETQNEVLSDLQRKLDEQNVRIEKSIESSCRYYLIISWN